MKGLLYFLAVATLMDILCYGKVKTWKYQDRKLRHASRNTLLPVASRHDTPLLLLAGNTENNCDDLFKYPVASMFHSDRLTDTQKDLV